MSSQASGDVPTQRWRSRRRPVAVDQAVADHEAAARYAAQERSAARGQRRRDMAALDAADVVWRLLRLAVWAIAVILGLAIIFHVAGANLRNSFVSTIDQWAHTLAGPFAGMFTLHSHKGSIALNYGIAIVVYIVLAELIIGVIGALIAPAHRRAASPAYGDRRYVEAYDERRYDVP